MVSPWGSEKTVSLSNSLGKLTTIFGKLRVCHTQLFGFFLQLLGAPPKGRATKN